MEVVLFDADGTLYEGFSIFPLYDAFEAENFVTTTENESVQELRLQYKDEVIDYPTLVKNTLVQSAATLKGKKEADANRISDEFFRDPNFPWFGYVKPIMKELVGVKAKLSVITAEPQFIARGIANALNMDGRRSSQFGADSGRYRGDLIVALNQKRKGDITEMIVRGCSRSTAFGDSEGDLEMLRQVNRAVCVKPSEAVRVEAENRRWKVLDNPDNPIVDLEFRLAS
jgi:phosphoserine phosphatase